MLRVQTYAPNQKILSAELNAIQDNAFGVVDQTAFVGATFGRMNGIWVAKPRLSSYVANQLVISNYGPLVLNNGVYPGYTGQILVLSSLAASTWYAVYAHDNGAGLTFDVYPYTTNAPNVELTLKNGDATMAYVGCFLTNATSQILSFTASRGHYTYRPSGSAVGNFENFLGALGPASYTSLPLTGTYSGTAKLIPPHAQVALMRMSLANGDSAQQTIYFKSETDSNDSIYYQVSPNTVNHEISAEMVVGATQALWYKSTNASCQIVRSWIMGFVE